MNDEATQKRLLITSGMVFLDKFVNQLCGWSIYGWWSLIFMFVFIPVI